MQRLMDVTRWVRLDSGKQVNFNVLRPRSVSLELNCPQETRIDLIDANGEIHFLALVKGRDKIEFQVLGEFALAVDKDECFIYSDDSEAVHLVNDAPETFTRIMQGRRQRNPELEYLAKKMSENLDRQLAKQARAYEGILERSIEARTAQPAAAGSSAGAGGEPTSDGDGKPPAEQASGAPDGGKGKAGDRPAGA